MLIRVTKMFEFESAHHLPFHEGKCKNLHGHNYKLEVTLLGELKTAGPEAGMVMDFSNLKKKVAEVIGHWDHAYLNDHISNPTAEIMVLHISHKLTVDLRLPVVSVKLWETLDSYAEWRKEDQV